eukprot:m.10214 g.10214  ORF g.10214 m.10214 type:complete len:51 (-) comp9613_c0_seq1:18-170(-)
MKLPLRITSFCFVFDLPGACVELAVTFHSSASLATLVENPVANPTLSPTG